MSNNFNFPTQVQMGLKGDGVPLQIQGKGQIYYCYQIWRAQWLILDFHDLTCGHWTLGKENLTGPFQLCHISKRKTRK